MVYNISNLPIIPQNVGNYINVHCPCVNTSNYLQNVTSDGDCKYNEMLGQLLKSKFPCVNASYGTGCKAHEMDHDEQTCKQFEGITDSSEVDKDKKADYAYCTSKWCYVDFDECYKSTEEMAGSSYFPGLFYSYTTCGNPDADFHKYASTRQTKNQQLLTTIPGSRSPFHYKYENENEKIVAPFDGTTYYNQNVKYEEDGVIIDYLAKLTNTAKQNNVTFKYQPRSGGSKIRSPNSAFTGAVTDVQAGISDMAAGMFWITSERLSMTTFTVPLFQAGLLLYQPELEEEEGLFHSARQMFKPFHTGLWILLCVFVIVVGILNVWFASRSGDRNKWRAAISDSRFQNAPFTRRVIVYTQLFLASILDSFVQCFGGGVSLDSDSTFPSKILAFGFGFFVLISISSYTANLTSFLTSRAQNGYISSMDAAVSKKTAICAAPVLKNMLKTKWKGGKFFFLEVEGGKGFDIKKAVNETAKGTAKGGKCDALLVEEWVIRTNKEYNDLFCKNNLITTNVKALDLNIAFPIREEYSAGISHYIKKLEQDGTFFYSMLEDSYVEMDDQCVLEIDTSTVENEQMTVSHMFVPISVLSVCILIACCLKAISKKKPAVFQAYDKTLELAGEDETIGGMNGSTFAKKEVSEGTGKGTDNEGSSSSTTNGSSKLHDFHDHLALISQDVVKLTQDMKQRNV